MGDVTLHAGLEVGDHAIDLVGCGPRGADLDDELATGARGAHDLGGLHVAPLADGVPQAEPVLAVDVGDVELEQVVGLGGGSLLPLRLALLAVADALAARTALLVCHTLSQLSTQGVYETLTFILYLL